AAAPCRMASTCRRPSQRRRTTGRAIRCLAREMSSCVSPPPVARRRSTLTAGYHHCEPIILEARWKCCDLFTTEGNIRERCVRLSTVPAPTRLPCNIASARRPEALPRRLEFQHQISWLCGVHDIATRYPIGVDERRHNGLTVA